MENNSEKTKVYIVFDLDKKSIWSVNSTPEKAKESEASLKEMRVGGADTEIIEEYLD